ALSHIPHPTSYGDQILSIKAVSANDVWAVGHYDTITKVQTLILHWNGSNWSQVSSPNPGGSNHDNALAAIDVASATDAWAVGFYDNGTVDQTLILHWNGSVWLPVTSVSPGAYENLLYAVAVVPGSGGHDVWAAGSYSNNSGNPVANLMEHWNGSA